MYSTKKERRENIGRAKAVDRGQYSHSYVHKPNNPLSGLPSNPSKFTVLGIETSCDDTGVAIVSSTGEILGESIASQSAIHEGYGGIVPGLARSAHEEACYAPHIIHLLLTVENNPFRRFASLPSSQNIQPTIDDALKKAGLGVGDVDAVAVTVGPGLEICLRVGCNKAREIAMENGKPFVAVHHLEAHILMSRLNSPLPFPFVALLVSGGHCQTLLCKRMGEYEVIGGTLDDSLGEAYDKVARMLGLPVGGGGGPAVEKLALLGNHTKVKLPIPMQHRKDCDFSFAGLKNAFRMAVEKMKVMRGLGDDDELGEQDKADLAASFQHAAIRHLEQRMNRVMTNLSSSNSPISVNRLVVVGGVAANKKIREKLEDVCGKHDWEMFTPEPRLCTDNGVMAAWAGVEKLKEGTSDIPDTQDVFARYPFATPNVTLTQT